MIWVHRMALQVEGGAGRSDTELGSTVFPGSSRLRWLEDQGMLGGEAESPTASKSTEQPGLGITLGFL